METIARKAVRAILFTPDQEVLLIQIANPDASWKGWIAPGGGIEPGESEHMALKRELNEELGLRHIEEARKIWTRFHSFPWDGKFLEQSEVFYFIPIEKFIPSTLAIPTAAEMMGIEEIRWWRLKDIQVSNEEFAPRALAAGLEQILKHGIPQEPFDVGP